MRRVEPFPSLIIRADGFEAVGSFAEAQAEFLRPDPETVGQLADLLREKNAGLVAHFYMDAELQGVLTACDWPHIHISDSLVMADRAVKMAEAGVGSILVMGVDFMSENVRAVLDAAGYDHVPVYRLDERAIGCSLAESAEARAYRAWLDGAAADTPSLHVIYINTSLEVKARSHAVVPTITCTSSNVMRTLLQAYAQIPGLKVYYGPDTYMGRNLEEMFTQLADGTDAEIQALHPAHDRASVRDLLGRFDYFKQGNCIVHHMFGEDVAERVRLDYADAYHTAHLEVPGEMFTLAAEAQRSGRGVVGSTSNILGFIKDRLEEQLERGEAGRLRFVLGTEAGMITSIVKGVQDRLQASGRSDVDVEIIFPVASEAVAQDDAFGVLPGVAGGEGCSTAGGCATCPYMKMNDLESLFDVLAGLGGGALGAYEPRKYTERFEGRTVADLGTEPILHMRSFQRDGALPEALVEHVLGA